MSIRKISIMSILTAGAIIISIIESFIPSFGIPGIKLGLANIIILIVLYELGVGEAIFVNLARVFLTGLLRGTILTMGFLMSLTGAIFSLGIMILFHLLIKKFSIIGISVLGAVFHVIGQILIAMLYLQTAYIWFYLPIIGISAVVTGVFVGIIAQLVIKTGVIRKQKEKYRF